MFCYATIVLVGTQFCRWFAMTKIIRLGRRSNLGYNTRREITSKDKRRYHHTIKPTQYSGGITNYIQWRWVVWHITKNVKIITHNTCSNFFCSKTRRHGVTAAVWQLTLYMHHRSFFSLPTSFLFRSVLIVKAHHLLYNINCLVAPFIIYI